MVKAIILLIIVGIFVIFIIIMCVIKILKQLKENHQTNNQVNIQLEELKKNYLFNEIIKKINYNESIICNDNKCSICLQNYISNKSIICLTPCNHTFHFYCLKKYIIYENKNKCPLCNYDLLSNLTQDENFFNNVEIIPLDENENPNNENNEKEKISD